jgi:hypothetical protein
MQVGPLVRNTKYVHFSGGESMKDLLKVKGILKDDKVGSSAHTL